LKINITVTINTTKQPQYLPKISEVSATTVAFFEWRVISLKKATVVAETSLILGKYCRLQLFCSINRNSYVFICLTGILINSKGFEPGMLLAYFYGKEFNCP